VQAVWPVPALSLRDGFGALGEGKNEYWQISSRYRLLVAQRAPSLYQLLLRARQAVAKTNYKPHPCATDSYSQSCFRFSFFL
jgi:hypothetical protein